MCRRRRADAHMHFLRARIAHHFNNLARSGAPHYEVNNTHYALASNPLAPAFDLNLYEEVTNRLFLFDECATDVVIADNALFKWNTACFSEIFFFFKAGPPPRFPPFSPTGPSPD